MTPLVRRVTFRFAATYDTRSVSVVGSFNNWDPAATPLSDSDGDNTWHAALDLADGVYSYKFLVDGKEYRLDPRNPEKETDPKGHENSILRVGMARLKGDVVFSPLDTDLYTESTAYVKAAFNHSRSCQVSLIITSNDTMANIPGIVLFTDGVYDYYYFRYDSRFILKSFDCYFECRCSDGRTEYYGQNGFSPTEWEVESFSWKRPDAPLLKTPDWVRDAQFYQVFPDRFFDADTESNPPQAVSKEILPDSHTFYGGDLQGVARKADYIKSLGMNTVYFNPIFTAPSLHKYDTSDYRAIDPHLGGAAGYNEMREALKTKGVRFILDGVFNHSGTGFAPFQDLIANGPDSKYKDWYYIKDFPIIDNGKPNYVSWWDFPSLPKLKMETPAVRDYFLETGVQWLKEGASGWRLDVPNEVDHWFWKLFRQAVKKTDPEAYIVGEIWQEAQEWLKGDEFDAVMNYRFRDACVEFFALRQTDAAGFAEQLGRQIYDYPMQANLVLLNLLSSHDTARFYTVCGRSTDRARLAAAFLFTYMGAPSVYYGEENGMEGAKDPDNRRFMIWDEHRWNSELHKAYVKLSAIRAENPVLRYGDIRFLYSAGMTVVFERFTDNDRLLIMINNSDQNINMDVTAWLGNGDFLDLYRKAPLKRKKAFTLYANDVVILKKIKER